MKKILTLSFYTLFTMIIVSAVQHEVLAQSFSFEHDSLFVNGPKDNLELIGYNDITNNTMGDLTLNWKRIEVSMANRWKSQVCDLNFCWEFSVSTGQFVMGNTRPSNIDVHFWPEGVAGDAQVEILVWVEGDSANSVQKAVYFGETWAVGIEESALSMDDLKLYPNPVIDRLSFSGLPSGFEGEVQILNVLGDRVASHQLNLFSNHSIELADLPKGLYIFAITDSKGETIGSRTFHKAQ